MSPPSNAPLAASAPLLRTNANPKGKNIRQLSPDSSLRSTDTQLEEVEMDACTSQRIAGGLFSSGKFMARQTIPALPERLSPPLQGSDCRKSVDSTPAASTGGLTKKRKVPAGDADAGIVIAPSALSFSSILQSPTPVETASLGSLHRSVSAPSFDAILQQLATSTTVDIREQFLQSETTAAVFSSTAPRAFVSAAASTPAANQEPDSIAEPVQGTNNVGLAVELAEGPIAPVKSAGTITEAQSESNISRSKCMLGILKGLDLSFQSNRAGQPTSSGISVVFLMQLASQFPVGITSKEVLKQVVLPMTSPHACRFVDMLQAESLVGSPSLVVCHFLDAPFHLTVQQIMTVLPPGKDASSVYVWMDVFSCTHHASANLQGDEVESTTVSPLSSMAAAAFAARRIWVSPTALISEPKAYQDAKQALSQCSRALLCLDYHVKTLSQPLSVSVLYQASALRPACEVLLAGEDVDLGSLQEVLQHLNTLEACAYGATLISPDSTCSASQRLRRMLLGAVGASVPNAEAESLESERSGEGGAGGAAGNSAKLLWLLGSKQYSEATDVAHELLKECASTYGLSHRETLKVICGLAASLYHEGEDGAEQADRLLAFVLEGKDALQQEGDTKGPLAAWLTNLAKEVQARGMTDKAEALLRWAAKLRLQSQDPNTPATIATLSSLAAVLELRGSYDEAEQLLHRRLAICECLYPAPHPDKASSLIHLGIILTFKGEFSEALQLARDGVQMRSDIFGEQHLAMAAGLADLASLLRKAAVSRAGAEQRNLLDEAEQMLTQCLKIRQCLLGPVHPDVLSTLDILTGLLQSQGMAERVTQLYENARVVCEAQSNVALGSVLTSWAGVLKQQGKFKEAEEMYREALALREKVLGTQHLDTATSMSNLAVLLHRQGSYDEAEDLCRSCLAVKQKLLGSSHPDVATVRNNLAALMKSQGRYDEAEQLYWKSLDALHKSFGRRPLEATALMNNLAALLEARGKLHMAEALYKEYLATIQERLGEEHPDLAVGMNNLAALLCRQGKYDEAEPLASRALSIWQSTLGLEHPDTAASLHNLAALYKAQCKYDAAQLLYAQSVEVTEKMLGPDHPNLAASLNNLAVLAQAQGNYIQAEPLYWRCLRIYEAALGPDHPNCSCTLGNLMQLLRVQGRDREAEELLTGRHVALPSSARTAHAGVGLWRSGSVAAPGGN